MRLFAAIPVPDPARAELARFLARLRATGWPVRWVRDDAMHLTLKFYGEVEESRVPAIAGVLGDAARGTGPLALTCREAGAFPTAARARVVWVGLEAEPGLELLQDRLERGSEVLGFPVEGRAFRPHLTLGRVREGERLPAGALESLEPPAAAFLATTVVLYESRPGPDGVRYLARHTVPLG